ncbi:hypothetical protein HO173_009156 [Letharia columbiana]|uniref:Uncharacterized protein n=1 Tax=Letharia columbiana TaxID=112416 RepID=A0A8H6L254_9LECA|nr:uncharacterized protein HO173_009156 [Letharia columbiana]KAF6232717.1 hypothetical protein HO173_009156 [Letharia columbiana]
MNFEDLKSAARRHIQAITAIHPTPALPRAFLSREARSTGLASLVENLEVSASARSTSQLFENIIVLNVYLAEEGNQLERDYRHNRPDKDAAIFLREWVAGAVLPTEAFAEASPYSIKQKATLTPDEVAKYHAMSLSGILLLSRLENIEPLSKDESVVTILTCLASFTDLNDPWTYSEAKDHACVLSEHYAATANLSTILTGLLQARVKPLFAKTKNPAITQQGRKAIDPLPSAATAHSDLDGETKPWKYRDAYIVTVFQWGLNHLDESSVPANWPLIIPPLLALIDDSSTKYKVKGCSFLAIFLQKCPSRLLERTGLGEIFENAVMPCLMSLPSLTEEAESLQLLKAAYPALISLAFVRFPDEKHQPARIKALDKILRNGILKGYAYAGEHVKIAEFLINEMAVLVNELDVESIKHLKHVLPLLTGILAAPFATAYPPLLQASVKAVQTIIVADWPRIAHHRGEILKGLTVCWCRIGFEEAQCQELKQVQESIERAVQLLTCVLMGKVLLVEEYQTLIDSDSRLRDLLVV